MKTPNYRKSTTTFKYTNPHPKGIRTVGDCVIRAISIATGKDWLTVYDELVANRTRASRSSYRYESRNRLPRPYRYS
jgi:hypothetical protein